MLKHKLILILVLIALTSCRNNQEKDKTISEKILKKCDYRDIDWNFDDLNNDVIMNLKLQTDFTLTKQNIYNQFQLYLKKSKIKRRFKSDAEFEKYRDVFLFRHLYVIIQNELLYQEGLRNEDIKVTDLDVERVYSQQKELVVKKSNLTFDQYLNSINITQKDFLETIKKTEYKKKVEELNVLRFAHRATPSEIQRHYNQLKKEKRYHVKFRELYLIEFPKDKNEVVIETIISDIKSLKDFQKVVAKESIHNSKRLKGRLVDMPLIMSKINKSKASKITQLLESKSWDIDLKKATLINTAGRNLVVWPERETTRMPPMDQKFQNGLSKELYEIEISKIRQQFIERIATSTSLKLKIDGKLQPVDLTYFINKSFQIAKESNPFGKTPKKENGKLNTIK